MQQFFGIYVSIILFFINRALSVYQLPQNLAQMLLHLPEDANLNFCQIANKYGYKCEEHRVITEDNYILTLFNIPGNRSRPVFLMHGFLDTADTFIIRAENSMSLTMARERNNDVWIGNMRGNKYSRDNLILNPNMDMEFWNFSFHEMAIYDLPAMIDYILKKTGQSQVQAIGHSEGTTVFYALASTRPEYNNKIKIFISLAPITYLQNTSKALRTIINLGPIINEVLKSLGIEELLGGSRGLNKFLEIICSNIFIGTVICADSVLFQIDGPDSAEVGTYFLPTIFGHYPAGTSRKNAMHLIQVSLRDKFAQYDYGLVDNLIKYKSTEPPEYDLSKVTMRIALFVGRNDGFSSVPDTDKLKTHLPNVVDYHIMAREQANHIDFIWAAHMYRDLFPYVFALLDKYS